MNFIIDKGYEHCVEPLHGQSRWEYWCDVVSDEYVNLECDSPEQEISSNFQGSLRGGIGVGRVRFSEVIADGQYVNRTRRQIAKSKEDDFLISFQVADKCIVKQFGREALLTPGSFALYDSTSEYSLSFAKPFHQIVLQMPREVLSRHLMDPERYTAVPIRATEGMGLILKDFLYSLVRELCVNEDPINDQLANNLINMIALTFSSSVMTSGLIEADCVREALIRRIRQFIDNNLFDSALNNSRIAESQGISVRYLHKVFESEPESVHELILDKRLRAAKSILSDDQVSRPSLESLADHVGFSSAAHFSRAFKEKFGICPSDVSPDSRSD